MSFVYPTNFLAQPGSIPTILLLRIWALMGYALDLNCLADVFFLMGFNKEIGSLGKFWHFEDSRWLGWSRYSSYSDRKGGQWLFDLRKNAPRRDWTYTHCVLFLDLFSFLEKSWSEMFVTIEFHSSTQRISGDWLFYF